MKNKTGKLALGLCLLVIRLSAVADIWIDRFDSSQSYPPCCGAYGTYYSFVSNVVQNGSGTVIVSGTALNEGGFYHDGLGSVLWDISTQTGLEVRVRAGTNNQTGVFWITFQDLAARRLSFKLPLTNTNFVVLTNALAQPSFADENFAFSQVKSVDVLGDFSQTNTTPFALELDYIKITGPVVGPRLIIERSGTNALLRWPTNTATVPVLEITTVLSSNWTAYATNPPVVGTNYQVTNAISGTKFFRLAFSSGQGFSLFSRTPKPASEDSGGNYPFTAAAVLPPNTFYTNTFIDVSDFNESWRYYYNGGEFDGLWENQGFTAWDSHNGGTNFYSSRYEEPPGTLIDEQQFPLALSPESFSGLVYAKFNYHVSFQVGNQFDEHTRSDLTKIHLHTAVCSPDRFDRFVLLSATVNEAFGAINPQSPWRPLLFSSNAIPFDKISLLGQQINADSMTFRKLGCNGTFDATPIINGLTNYVFNVSIAAHKIVNLTWSFHQMFQIESNTPPTRAGLQAKFDAGSVILGTDDDVKTPDSDPSVAYSTNASSPYRTDDVPVYVEFKISDGPTNLSYFTRTLRPVFPIDFGPSRYFNIVSMEDLDQLLNWTGANLKLVKKIMIPGIGTGNGVAKQGVKPASIVLAESATDVTCIHEWGHSCGLYHRASTDTNGVPLNPGPTLNAIMGPPTLVIDRKEVNRFERDAMNNY